MIFDDSRPWQSAALHLWRAVARDAPLPVAVDALHTALGTGAGVDSLALLRADPDRLDLRCVASAGPAPPGARIAFTDAAWQELRAPAPGAVLAAGAATHAVYPHAADARAGVLRDQAGAGTGLVVVARTTGRLDAQAADGLAALLEPLAALLEREDAARTDPRSRAAVDADRQALLARLGRGALTDAIVGAESGLRAVMERVDQVAGSDSAVLLLGETGSGKEVVARAIHDRSRRTGAPFVRVNCGALAPELVDSELFGHEKGSFTGASAQRRGWFERADGGTLFLDEVGELPPAVQVRLLRVLQDGTLQRVGGERTVQVNVRIVAATHRDLPAMVATGDFREDLWYRLAVFPVRIPPLRERAPDIPALAQHFARRAAVRLGLPLRLPGGADLALLRAYRWPGNVRELATVIERAALLGSGAHLDCAAALGMPAPARAGATAGPRAPAAAAFLTLDAAMAAHIRAALARTGGRIEGPRGAARLLAINPHTLRARMRRLGVDAAQFRTPDGDDPPPP